MANPKQQVARRELERAFGFLIMKVLRYEDQDPERTDLCPMDEYCSQCEKGKCFLKKLMDGRHFLTFDDFKTVADDMKQAYHEGDDYYGRILHNL